MEIDIDNISEDQNRYIQSYKRINERLETLQKQMTLIQYETQELLNELEELRNLEIKTYKNGKK
jgi:septation ring formation regulator EzrA